MAPVPLEVRLDAAIRAVDQQIAQARNVLAGYALASPPQTPPIDAVSALMRLLEKRHALLLQKTYPRARVYTQITFGPVMDPDTGRAIWLRRAGARRPDMGVLDGETLYLIEAKVEKEILDMFPKRSKARGEIEVKLKKSSTFGAQWRAERSLLNRALRRGAYQEIRGTPVLGGPRETRLVRTTEKNEGGSHPQVYGNMGDGLPIRAPGAPPTPSIRRVQPMDLQPSQDVIRAAKLNQPVTVTGVKPNPTTPAKPGDLFTVRGVAIRAPGPSRMVDNRGTPKTDPAAPGTAEPPQPRWADRLPLSLSSRHLGFSARASLAQGVAQGFQLLMLNAMHASAAAAAERAANSEAFLTEVANARRGGRTWVLVTAYFAESVSGAAGARHLVFLWLGLQVVEALPGESPQRTLTRLRQAKMPAQYKQRGEHRVRGFDPTHWNIVRREMSLFPGEPIEEVISEVDPRGPIYGTRCVAPRLR